MFILIIWSSLCTGIDPDCLTGDFLEIGQYEGEKACERDAKAWIVSAKDHRAICYYREV